MEHRRGLGRKVAQSPDLEFFSPEGGRIPYFCRVRKMSRVSIPPTFPPSQPPTTPKWVWFLAASVTCKAVVQIDVQGRQDCIWGKGLFL